MSARSARLCIRRSCKTTWVKARHYQQPRYNHTAHKKKQKSFSDGFMHILMNARGRIDVVVRMVIHHPFRTNSEFLVQGTEKVFVEILVAHHQWSWQWMVRSLFPQSFCGASQIHNMVIEPSQTSRHRKRSGCLALFGCIPTEYCSVSQSELSSVPSPWQICNRFLHGLLTLDEQRCPREKGRVYSSFQWYPTKISSVFQSELISLPPPWRAHTSRHPQSE
jgi:hypothetical protein